MDCIHLKWFAEEEVREEQKEARYGSKSDKQPACGWRHGRGSGGEILHTKNLKMSGFVLSDSAVWLQQAYLQVLAFR